MHKLRFKICCWYYKTVKNPSFRDIYLFYGALRLLFA